MLRGRRISFPTKFVEFDMTAKKAKKKLSKKSKKKNNK